MAQEPEDFLTFSEAAERSWRGYLSEFKEKVYPIFQPYGFTLPEAFAAWSANNIRTEIIYVVDYLKERDEL